jgi:hypothetical protein
MLQESDLLISRDLVSLALDLFLPVLVERWLYMWHSSKWTILE